MKYFFILILLIVFTPEYLFGQTDVTFDTSDEYYLRILQITGMSEDQSSHLIRPYSFNSSSFTPPIQTKLEYNRESYFRFSERSGINFFEPVWFQSYNTSLPRGVNDGALWQGRGYNTAISAGVKGIFGPLHVRFRPIIGLAQNLSYDLGPYPSFNEQNYSYRLTRIDYVQRYGDSSYKWANLGDSSVELRGYGLRTGFSNQRVWTGPAVYNPLIYGYNAPGFLHFHVTSDGPINTRVGNFEFSYLYGGLRVSDYFEGIAENNLTSVKSFIFSYTPSFAEGLSFGAIRVFQDNWPSSFSEIGSELTKIFEPFLKSELVTEDSPRGADADNQMATVFARWYFKDAGFDVYFEYGRNDHNFEGKDFRTIPNHHRAYILGFIKAFHIKNNRLLTINYEMNQHEPTRSALILGGVNLSWHPHGGQRQGFTNRGQIIATGHGPGNNIQTIASQLFGNSYNFGLRLSKITFHNGRLYNNFATIQEANSMNINPYEVRNTELLLGIQFSKLLSNSYELLFAIDQSYILNQHYIYKNDIYNARFEITVRKRIDGWLR